MECVKRSVDIAAKIEARPLVAAAKGILARSLTASGGREEARDELVQALMFFDQSGMTA
jgi:hypothetical protein